MIVCEVALANFGMEVHNHLFSYTVRSCNLAPLAAVLSQLPEGISWRQDRVEVELKRFDDRTLNRDLEILCTKVAQEQPCLPDGHHLLFRLQEIRILHLDAQEKEVA